MLTLRLQVGSQNTKTQVLPQVQTLRLGEGEDRMTFGLRYYMRLWGRAIIGLPAIFQDMTICSSFYAIRYLQQTGYKPSKVKHESIVARSGSKVPE